MLFENLNFLFLSLFKPILCEISSVNDSGCVGFVYLCDLMPSIIRVRLVYVSLEFPVLSYSCDLLLVITRV